jgi:hypothetical protein
MELGPYAMSVHSREILASVIAGGVLILGARAVHVRARVRLRLVAWRRRRAIAAKLRASLGGTRRGSLRQARRELLAASFRLRGRPAIDRPPGDAKELLLGARALLKRINSAPDVLHLVTAESGYGKSVLGMTLALLREPLRRGSLIPLYVDLGAVTSEQPLAELDQLLRRLAGAEFGGLSGNPLFVLDAPNEAVEPEELVRLLAAKRAALNDIGARLLFLFSFRDRSYPGALRSGLLSHGYQRLDTLELLFDVEDDTDLRFLRELLRIRGRKRGRRAQSRQLIEAVRVQTKTYPGGPNSRTAVSAFVEWRLANPDSVVAPSPAQLLFAQAVRSAISPSPALRDVSRIAFLLLGEEHTAVPYAAIERKLGITEARVRSQVPASGLTDQLECASDHLRFQNENTIRALGGLYVAGELADGTSPGALRGHTRYDVCASYVLPALQWLILARSATAPDSAPATAEAFAAIIKEELKGVDAPYSFYATVLCTGGGGVLGAAHHDLDEKLFREMVQAIDDDRVETCRASLAAAGRAGAEIGVAPVLDQLFEVVRIYRGAAAGLLRTIMDDDTALIRSQGAYLLHDWVGRASAHDASPDREILTRIIREMRGDDPNLHFRFHQVELLESLLPCFPDGEDSNRKRVLDILEAIADCRGTEPGPDSTGGVYGELQALISARAEDLVRPPREGSHPRPLVSFERSVGRLTELNEFRTIGSGSDAEARLECWEVALASAARVTVQTSQNLRFVRFIERSLTHEFWIVRWWGFANLMAILRTADAGGSRVLAELCAGQIARQLCTSIEPMGLKHRECALVSELLEDRRSGTNASRILADALRSRARTSLTPAARSRFSQSYYEALSAPPDDYLWEYSRRLEEIVPTTPGDR